MAPDSSQMDNALLVDESELNLNFEGADSGDAPSLRRSEEDSSGSSASTGTALSHQLLLSTLAGLLLRFR